MIYKNFNYSFFGTCSNDNYHVKCYQDYNFTENKPKEVILVDSGDKNNYETYVEFFNSKNIDFVYV